MHDLAVIIVSTNESEWLRRCLPTVADASQGIDVEVIVVSNGPDPTTRSLVEQEFGWAHVVDCANHGFAHANNRGLMVADSRHVLFLNPDTEVVEGSFAGLIAWMEANPRIGLAGCRQLNGEGELQLTMRRFPTAARVVSEALGSERWPFRAAWTGQRCLDEELYDQEFELDWTVGSFMFTRREALESAGWLDERLFLYSDDPDLGLRIKRAGWEVRHFPHFTIIHQADKMGWSERGYGQYAYANRVYFTKHLVSPYRQIAVAGLALGYGLRALLFPLVRRSEPDAARAMRAAWRCAIGKDGSPYEPPPATALRQR